MNEELVERRLGTCEKRLDKHGDRIDELEKREAARDVKIDNLCEKLENQTKAIYWLIGLGATSLLGFFFYAIQSNLFN
jgi:uncharacterized coiled-coil protein SlyX